jgi:hypothetical protein
VAGDGPMSSHYHTRFMLRLNDTTTQKLQYLVDHFGKPRAEIIRQLIAQAKAEDFPPELAAGGRGTTTVPKALLSERRPLCLIDSRYISSS